MAERSDNVDPQADAIEAHNNELVRQLLENGDGALASAPPADIATPTAAPPPPAEAHVDIKVLAALAAVDVKTPIEPEPKRNRCSVVDGLATFSCPLCNGIGFERSSAVNTGHFAHGRRTKTPQSSDGIEKMYIREGAVGCGKQIRIISKQVTVVDDPPHSSVPRLVTEYYVEEVL